MRETTKSALVPFTVEQMFALVEDFERYSEFLPWVTSSRLIERGRMCGGPARNASRSAA